MDVSKDEQDILSYIYQNKIDGKEVPTIDEIIKKTNLDRDKIVFYIEYLIEEGFLKGKLLNKFRDNKNWGVVGTLT